KSTSSCFDLLKNEFGDGLQGIKNAFTRDGDGAELRNLSRIELSGELFHGDRVRKVSLVVLDDEGDRIQVVSVLGQVGPQVLHGLEVGVEPVIEGVGHEDHAVHAAQDQLPRRVVEDLPWHRIEVEAGLETADFTKAK